MSGGPTLHRDPMPGSAPEVGSAAVPVWVFVLFAVLGYWSMQFLDGRAGGFHPSVYGPYRSLEYVEAMQPKSGADMLFASGQKVYATYCSVCHQPTGSGVPNQFPPLTASEWVQAETPNRIIRLILDGIQGPIVVKGQNYNGAMPPWRELLTDEDIAAVATFIRQNEAWGNTASEVTPDQVKAIREKTAGRVGSWSPDQLLSIPLNE